MKILGHRFIQGPNVFHSKPVLVLKLDLMHWADLGSHEIPGLTEKLVQGLPGLEEHTCSPGHRGGFVERLRRGTYLGHIIEHVAIEICNRAGIPISYGKTNYVGDFGVYDIALRCLNEEATLKALTTAVNWVQGLLEDLPFDLARPIDEIRELYLETKMGPSSLCLIEAADRRGIPYRTLGAGSLIQLGYGKYRRRLQTAISDRTSLIAAEMVQDKFLTKKILDDASVPVPFGLVVRSEEELLQAAEKFPGPYAIKPLDGHHGEGVVLNLQNRDELFKAYLLAKEYCSSVLVEEMCPGNDFRVLVIGGRFSAAAVRYPPQVKGDGKTTLIELIRQLNSDPRRAEGHDGILSRIHIDESVIVTLKKQKLELDSVPRQGQTVILRGNANLSGGGTAVDVTDQVHPEIRSLCERISRIVDLDICGIDIIAEDLSNPLDSTFKVIEVNAGPGLRMHLAPDVGQARNVGDEIVEWLYPSGSPSRIPIVAVTGTNGKTTTVRLIHKILSPGQTVGLTTSDGVYIGTEKVAEGDMTGPTSAQIVLSDPSIDQAVLEVARGGILRRGLAYDWSDVGVVTNIRPDHIGQDGIETLEDLVWIKSLVAERVRAGGTLVLNADDEQSIALRHSPRIIKVPRNFFYYSTQSRNPILLEHQRRGLDCAWCEDGWLYLQFQKQVHKLVATKELNFTLQGKAGFQVSNALAAIAASSAMGASVERIVEGLTRFDSGTENRGRLNLYRIREGHVILDYGHNPDAIAAVGELVSSYPALRKTLIFGLPGDRSDEVLRMSAETAARNFNRLLVRDDHDLRGRAPQEVPALIEAEVRGKFSEVECRICHSEKEAVESVLDSVGPRDLVVVLFDSFSEIMPLIRQYDPVPVSVIPETESALRHPEHPQPVSQEKKPERGAPKI